MRVLSASKTEVFFKLRLYSSLPYLFSALRIAASMSVIGAVVGEWIGSTRGIGALILQATYNFDSALRQHAPLLVEFYARVSDQSKYYRFFSPMPGIPSIRSTRSG